MAQQFADLPEALANTLAIAQRCNLTIPLGKNHLPEFPTPRRRHASTSTCATKPPPASSARLAALYPDAADARAQAARVRSRGSSSRRATIVQMGFAGYFLIVADFINWAKRNGVPVGPGRGSGAGSLVAYALGITDLDPLRYELLFERFLNPERVSMPDFDIDFCQDGRDRVIDYVKQKYGADSVSQIATFGTLAAKAAVRDVGRVLDLPYSFVDGIAKLIPFQPGKHGHAAAARTATRESNVIYAREVEPLINEREKRRGGSARAAGARRAARRPAAQRRHARRRRADRAGQAHRLLPAVRAARRRRARCRSSTRTTSRRSGLVKFDFLGLTTLTILDWTLRYVRRLDPRVDASRSRRCRSTTRPPTTSSARRTPPPCSSSNRAACATS